MTQKNSRAFPQLLDVFARRQRGRERDRDRPVEEKGEASGHDSGTRRNLSPVFGSMQRGSFLRGPIKPDLKKKFHIE